MGLSDPARLATTWEDAEHLTTLLALIPNGPHETVGSVWEGMSQSGDIIAVDNEAGCRMHVRRESNEFFILWWVWKGNDRKAWQRCLLFVLEEAVRQYGPTATGWAGSGEFSGRGTPGEERQRNAEVVAERALPTLAPNRGKVAGTLALGLSLMRRELLA